MVNILTQVRRISFLMNSHILFLRVGLQSVRWIKTPSSGLCYDAPLGLLLSSVGLPVSGQAWRATAALRGARSCWRGTLLWKQQWRSLCGGERSPPGTEHGTELTLAFQLASGGFFFFSINPPAPLSPLAFTPTLSLPLQLHFPPRILNFFSNSLTSLFVPPRLPSSQFQPFLFAAQRQPLSPGRTKTPSENAKPTQKCHNSLGFGPEIHCGVTLCVPFTEGSLFSIACVWERVRCRSGGWPRARLEKNREWGRSAKKGLTGHLYWRCEVQQRLQHAQSYLLKIHGSARSIRSLFFWFLHLEMREDGRSSLARWVAVSFIRWPDAGLQKMPMLLWSFSTKDSHMGGIWLVPKPAASTF